MQGGSKGLFRLTGQRFLSCQIVHLTGVDFFDFFYRFFIDAARLQLNGEHTRIHMEVFLLMSARRQHIFLWMNMRILFMSLLHPIIFLKRLNVDT